MTTAVPARSTDRLAPLAIAVEQITTGLMSIAGERTLGGIYRAAAALIVRLPGVSGVAILRPDDRGMLSAVYAVPTGIPAELVEAATGSLHQRWIASHAPGAPAQALGPYAVDDRPELVVVPLVAGDLLVGGLLLAGRRGTLPLTSAAERLAASAIGTCSAQAIEALLLRQRLELTISRTEHETELTNARRSISRELHDGPTQDLALAGLALDRLVTMLGEDQATSADARQARDLIDRAVLGMRSAIGKLRSTQPAPSITGPLRQLLAEMAPAAPGMEVDFAQVSGVRLAPEVERAMIGIVREALHNVRKHANAESVRLEVRRVEDAVEIAVIDDGVGIQSAALAGHFGLEQIKELAEGTGGTLEIRPAPGQGTSVRAWIPLPGTGDAGQIRPLAPTGS